MSSRIYRTVRCVFTINSGKRSTVAQIAFLYALILLSSCGQSAEDRAMSRLAGVWHPSGKLQQTCPEALIQIYETKLLYMRSGSRQIISDFAISEQDNYLVLVRGNTELSGKIECDTFPLTGPKQRYPDEIWLKLTDDHIQLLPYGQHIDLSLTFIKP